MVLHWRKAFERQVKAATRLLPVDLFMNDIRYDGFQCSNHPLLPGPDLYKGTLLLMVATMNIARAFAYFHKSHQGGPSLRVKKKIDWQSHRL